MTIDPQFTELIYERKGQTGWVTLDSPGWRNMVSPTMVRELHAVLDLVSQDAEVRFLVITGAGATFCTGVDIRYYRRVMEANGGAERFVDELVEPFGELIARLRTAPVLVIAAVNGPSVAAGQRIALSCDIIMSGDDASFGDTRPRDGGMSVHGRGTGSLFRSGCATALSRTDNPGDDPAGRANLVNRVEWLIAALGTGSMANLRALKTRSMPNGVTVS